MKLFLITILLLISDSIFSQKMDPYWKAINSRKMKFYYEDSHTYDYSPEHLPNNISKEYIFNFSSNLKDSMLETEITYDNNKRPIEIKEYAIPSEGALVEVDSFYYNTYGLLEKKIEFNKGYYGGIDTVIIKYVYDNEQREISKISTEKYYPYKWLTSYGIDINGKKIKTRLEIRQSPDTSKEVFYFGKDGRLDSSQIYDNGKWFATAQYEFDSLNKIKYHYVRYATYRALRAKIIYNETGYPIYSLTNEFMNWNREWMFDVEWKYYYDAEGFTKECELIIKGKKRYLKKHYFK
jgi:hypothetical protein